MTIQWARLKPADLGIYVGRVSYYTSIRRVSEVSSGSSNWELEVKKCFRSLKEAKEAAERLS